MSRDEMPEPREPDRGRVLRGEDERDELIAQLLLISADLRELGKERPRSITCAIDSLRDERFDRSRGAAGARRPAQRTERAHRGEHRLAMHRLERWVKCAPFITRDAEEDAGRDVERQAMHLVMDVSLFTVLPPRHERLRGVLDLARPALGVVRTKKRLRTHPLPLPGLPFAE